MAGAGTKKAVFVTGVTLLVDEELEVEELAVEELEELVAEELEELVAEELEELVAEELEEVAEDEELLLLLPPPKICESRDAIAANPILPCSGTAGAM
ncbi:hypothetical protein DAPPUDRAFT_248951 [Daphnia pulex]|uniref:Uncharacterized protein n=1 Tax=Daphnia pulex TaxID=6669 RepID=E9GVJ6_DAPPU|nr:hypothetical protein DAPPUDRAFT_248951 [Daphnia pulex]|eukprot:EFX76424.1 hypothetical protein DAPPUDRAFT_248951 [Daphnia pulex]